MASTETQPTQTAVNFRHSANLASLLDQLGLSVLISTYQAGKVVSVGTHAGAVNIQFHHFEQAMGIARTPTGLAVGAKRQIWYLEGANELAAKIAPVGTYDLALLTRRSHFTGPIMGHEMAWGERELWVVNTGFSCLCTINPNYNFMPRWKPKFISQLAAEDRCHLNGMAMQGNVPRYVTALGQTDTAAGWRANKASGGCLIDVPSNEIIVTGLCMPHSPRVYGNQLVFLNSGKGELALANMTNGQVTPIIQLDGYTRGMEIHGQYAFIGLSKIRETSVFGGLPIAERRQSLLAGLSIVDLARGEVIGFLHFDSGVDEVFEVKVVPGYRNPIISGPLHDDERSGMIWLASPL